ncbi:keratin-associated protein 19-2-like [Anopheles aquasalis]|uniref:keratin-associated protein 19-2-like n=1 Tax=Anopheles aquasalis TaxID=42839 RepID=UPI00215AB77B|nr:keratin-associated protein 19-2-like [Anopheles aquasalis]
MVFRPVFVVLVALAGVTVAIPIQNTAGGSAVAAPASSPLSTRLDKVEGKAAVASADPEADRNKRHLGFGGIGIGVGLIGGGFGGGFDPYDYGGPYGGFGGPYGGYGGPYGGYGGPYGGFGGPFGGGPYGGPYGGYANGYQYGYGSGFSNGFFG